MPVEQDRVLVVDLEATCWRKNPPPGEQSEIIEIGICVLKMDSLTPQDKRSILVKPSQSKVSEFCTNLTSLTQEQVDTGITFKEACDILESDYDAKRYLWSSWGGYDLRMFTAQCDSFGVSLPFSDHHVNLKQLYADLRRDGRKCGMARALRLEAIEMQGHHHRGDDDAWNTARILAKLIIESGQDILTEFWS